MKKLFFILLCILLVLPVLQVSGQEYKTRKDLEIDLEVDDTDALVMDGDRYLINKSFLRPFKGYKTLYPEVQKYEIDYGKGMGSEDYAMNYQPYWVIKDSAIYMVGVFLDTDSNRKMELPEERYTRIEKLTGATFKEGVIDPREYDKYLNPKYSKGALFGEWINGVYYIKPVMKFPDDFRERKKGPFLKPVTKASDYIRQWEKAPILKLTIKKGHIVKIEKI